jgi:hypothetical protein
MCSLQRRNLEILNEIYDLVTEARNFEKSTSNTVPSLHAIIKKLSIFYIPIAYCPLQYYPSILLMALHVTASQNSLCPSYFVQQSYVSNPL